MSCHISYREYQPSQWAVTSPTESISLANELAHIQQRQRVTYLHDILCTVLYTYTEGANITYIRVIHKIATFFIDIQCGRKKIKMSNINIRTQTSSRLITSCRPSKKSSFKNVFKNVVPFHHMNKKVTRPPVQYHPPRVKATIRHCYIYIPLKETVPREFLGTAIYSYIHLKETVPREFLGTAIYSYIHLKETVPREFSGTAIYSYIHLKRYCAAKVFRYCYIHSP